MTKYRAVVEAGKLADKQLATLREVVGRRQREAAARRLMKAIEYVEAMQNHPAVLACADVIDMGAINSAKSEIHRQVRKLTDQ